MSLADALSAAFLVVNIIFVIVTWSLGKTLVEVKKLLERANVYHHSASLDRSLQAERDNVRNATLKALLSQSH